MTESSFCRPGKSRSGSNIRTGWKSGGGRCWRRRHWLSPGIWRLSIGKTWKRRRGFRRRERFRAGRKGESDRTVGISGWTRHRSAGSGADEGKDGEGGSEARGLAADGPGGRGRDGAVSRSCGMGMNADRLVAIGAFERGHLQHSFKRSLVALPVALATSLPGFPGLRVVGACGGAFWLGWRVGGRVQRGEARRAEGFVARFVAWDDARPGLLLLVGLLPMSMAAENCAFLAIENLSHVAFGRVPKRGVEGLGCDGAMGNRVGAAPAKSLAATYESVSGWDKPWLPLLAAAAVWLGIVSGLTDGLWAGSAQSRIGARFGQTIPFGRDWTEWRQERRERRQACLGGGG